MKWLGRHISRLLGRSLTRAFTILLPACIRDSAVAWFKDLNKTVDDSYVQDEIGDRTDDVFYGQYLAENSVTGLLDFDGIGDYVSFGDTADIIRNSKTVAFEMNLEENASTDYFSVLAFKSTNAGDFLSVAYSPGLGMFRTRSSTFAGGGRDYDISAYRNQLIEVVITKVSTSVIQLTVNGVAITPIGDTSGTEPTFSYIGYGDGIYEYANYFTIWNVRIYDGTITNSWLGNPDGNTDAAWVDDTGSYDGTVFGTPGVTETPYYINFYRTSGTFDYTDPSDGSLVEDISIPGTGLYTIPANGVCDIKVDPYYPEAVVGLLDFDGVDDVVTLPATVDVTGNKTIDFKCYINDSVPGEDGTVTGALMCLSQDITDLLWVNINKEYEEFAIYSIEVLLNAGDNTNPNASWSFDLDLLLLNTIIDISIVKTAGQISSCSVNGSPVTLTSSGNGEIHTAENLIGAVTLFSTTEYLSSTNIGYIWSLGIGSSHSYPGSPDGNTNTAWVDGIGTDNGAVSGSPTTIDLNFGDKSYVSYYPVCERAGTVLHDVNENSIHISVTMPSWSETLYGSDYLNQYGFANKAESDIEGYDWTTSVDGNPIALDNNTLIPLKKKNSLVSNTIDGPLNMII